MKKPSPEQIKDWMLIGNLESDVPDDLEQKLQREPKAKA